VVGGIVFAVPFDATRLEVSGTAVPVIQGVRRPVGTTTGTAHFVTSPAGSLAYVPGPTDIRLDSWSLAMAGRTEAVTRLPVQPGPYSHVRVSRDGSHIAVGSDDSSREANVWIYRLESNSVMRRLTLMGRNRYPVWLPDGQRVAFQSDRDGDEGIFVQRIDGNAGAERLTKAAPGETHIPDVWSPDGTHMLFAVRKAGSYALMAFSAADKQIRPIDGVQSNEPTGAVFSPDGRWIAYASSPVPGGTRSLNRGIFVQPFPPTGAIYQVPSEVFDFHPVWNPKGMELIYVPSATTGELSSVKVTADSGMAFGAAARFPAVVTGQRVSSLVRAWDILPDGRFVGLFNAAGNVTAPNTSELRIVINWFEELRARVPTR
jgi:Tol biopolymer transport system component